MLTAAGPGGINEIQYAALLMMIARHTEYLPGVFSHLVVNEQIYDRHIEQANEMLERFYNNVNEGLTYPRLMLKPDATDFYEMTVDDFELIDYEPIKPQLKLELGI
jgi:thymidylate synthase